MTTLNTVLSSVHGNVAMLTMNRPDKRNALNHAMRVAFVQRMQEAERDPQVRAIVITGAGDASFVAGADLAELLERHGEARQSLLEEPSVYGAIDRVTKPVIAAINGFCIGGGMELALACDLRFAAESATFCQPEVTLGLIPGGGATQRLPRIVGMGVAMRLILTGTTITAEHARRIGLVDDIMPGNVLIDHTMAVAQRIARLSPVAVAAARQATRAAFDRPLAEGIRLERELFLDAFATREARDGIEGFLVKRAPSYGAH